MKKKINKNLNPNLIKKFLNKHISRIFNFCYSICKFYIYRTDDTNQFVPQQIITCCHRNLINI